MQSESADERDPETYATIGAAMEVHRELGPGFLEAVYQEAMGMEMKARGIPFEREAWLTISYKGVPLVCKYKVDFLCYGRVVLETKALKEITGSHRAQVMNYMKATGMRKGLVVNFGLASLRYERIVM